MSVKKKLEEIAAQLDLGDIKLAVWASILRASLQFGS
jgi:hypothetical protein